MHTFIRTTSPILAATLALATTAWAQERIIEQGKTFGDLSGNEGQLTVLRLDVPRGLDGMVIELWGGQGNLDLFVRRGKVPDGKHFDYQSASPTNTERAVIPNPGDGPWYIGLYGRAAFSGASIRVTFRGMEAGGPPVPVPVPVPPPVAQTQPVQVAPPPVAGPPVQVPAPIVAPPPMPVTAPPTSQPPAPEPAVGPPSARLPSAPPPPVALPPPPPPAVAPPPPPAVAPPPPVALAAIPLLMNGQHAGPLAGAIGEGFTFRLAVPPGATRLRLAVKGGQGDVDMYVHYGLPPLPQRFTDLASRLGAAPAAVSEILDPAEGLWFVRVQGKTAFKDLALTVTFEPAAAPVALPPSPPPAPAAPH